MIDLESPDYLERTGSDMLVELHVYVMPTDLWSDHLHSAVNQIVGETVSAGFIRVYPETQLSDIRNQITKQLGHDVVPKNYVFLRCIGRCFTQVKHKQERELKAKHFIPPIAQVPELIVLDAKLSTDNDDDESEIFRSTDLFRGQRGEEDEDKEEEGNHRLLRVDDEERRSRLLAVEEIGRRRRGKTTPPPLRELSEDEESRILRELERLKRRRNEMEREREELMKKMKRLEAKQYSRINNARDVWKKRYFEEKKKTPPVEDQCSRLRQQVEGNHRKDIAHLESLQDSCERTSEDGTYEQIALRIQALQYEHEIEDLHTKLQNVKMKITTEIRLRYQTECQLQALRAELAQRKLSLMFNRSEAYRAQVQDPFVSTSRTPTEASYPTPRRS